MTTNATGPADRRTTVDEPSLTEFLLARIAEDEAVAREVDIVEWCVGDPQLDDAVDEVVPWQIRDQRVVDSADGRHYGWAVIGQAYGEEKAEHIARHDPARVRAECEAKRRIVERVTECDREAELIGERQGILGSAALDTLGLLAAVYSDHPDYRAEWRP